MSFALDISATIVLEPCASMFTSAAETAHERTELELAVNQLIVKDREGACPKRTISKPKFPQTLTCISFQ